MWGHCRQKLVTIPLDVSCMECASLGYTVDRVEQTLTSATSYSTLFSNTYTREVYRCNLARSAGYIPEHPRFMGYRYVLDPTKYVCEKWCDW